MQKFVCCMMALLLAVGLAACAAPAAQQGTGQPAAAQAAEPTAEPTPEPTPDAPIVFTDAALEGLVRKAMNRPDGDILLSEAAAVTELHLDMDGNDWSQERIHDLSDLAYFPNVVTLSLGWAVQNAEDSFAAVDLGPIAQLTKLENLWIAGVNFADVSPLAGLTQLKGLEFWGSSQFHDVSPLANLTGLEFLRLRGNMISDIGPLSGLTNLHFLDISDNIITDVTPIAGLTNLESLFVSKNLIKDYSPLSEVASDMSDRDFEPVAAPQAIDFGDAVLEQKVRKALGIPEGDITIADTEGVTELSLGNEWQEKIPDDIKIRDISALKYFPNLFKAELWFNGIDRIGVLRALPNLGFLDLNGNPVYDITPVASCTNLKVLNISGTNTNNISALAGLTQLESLNLSYMPNLGNIEPVSNLTNLKELRLENVNVPVEPISNLTNLTTLYICQPTDKYLLSLADIYPNLVDKNFELPQG